MMAVDPSDEVVAGVRPLLSVRNLEVGFSTAGWLVPVVRGVSLDVGVKDSLALVGESGSGKSVTARTIMGILRSPPGRVTGGEIMFRGEDLLAMSEPVRRKVRGTQMTMVFQEALAALNPVLSVGYQIGELFRAHRGCSRAEARERTVEIMGRVRIPHPERRVRDYPHQFSGGMRQRVVIAMALALNPRLVIADEPTTALDVTIQAQIVELLEELLEAEGTSLLLITHDLGVASSVARTLAVMYAGRIVEVGHLAEIFAAPAHPYTFSLMESVRAREVGRRKLVTIKGSPPDLAKLPAGCPFAPRCNWATEVCRTEEPSLRSAGVGRFTACHHWSEVLTDNTMDISL